MQFFMNPLVTLLSNETEDDDGSLESSPHPPGRLERIVWFLNSVCIPGVVMVGLLLNIACCSTMRGSRLAAQTYSPYFFWLAVSDSAFLVSLLIVWSTSVGLTDLYTRDGWCLTVTYVSGVCAFLAPWFHVGLATDRFLVTVCGHRSTPGLRCSSLRSHVVCLGLFLVAVPAYLNSSLIYGVVETRFGRLCVALPRFVSVVQVLAELELLFTVIIPSITIIALDLATVFYLSTHCVARRRRPVTRTTRLESGFYAHDRASPCGLLEAAASPGDDLFGQPVVVPASPTRNNRLLSLLEVSPGSSSSFDLPSVRSSAAAAAATVSADVRPTVSVVLSTVAFLLLSLPAQLLQSWVMLSSMSADAETTFQVPQQVILVQYLLLSIWYVRFGCSFPLQLALNPRVHAQLNLALKKIFRFRLKRNNSDFTSDSF